MIRPPIRTSRQVIFPTDFRPCATVRSGLCVDRPHQQQRHDAMDLDGQHRGRLHFLGVRPTRPFHGSTTLRENATGQVPGTMGRHRMRQRGLQYGRLPDNSQRYALGRLLENPEAKKRTVPLWNVKCNGVVLLNMDVMSSRSRLVFIEVAD